MSSAQLDRNKYCYTGLEEGTLLTPGPGSSDTGGIFRKNVYISRPYTLFHMFHGKPLHNTSRVSDSAPDVVC